jgi:hypothetical protein
MDAPGPVTAGANTGLVRRLTAAEASQATLSVDENSVTVEMTRDGNEVVVLEKVVDVLDQL